MTNPITPPPELVQQWADMLSSRSDHAVFSLAAQWGADQELEACVEWLDRNSPVIGGFHLRIDRRPKPPRLKEQALEAQQRMWDGTSNHDDWNLIRRALEALDD